MTEAERAVTTGGVPEPASAPSIPVVEAVVGVGAEDRAAVGLGVGRPSRIPVVFCDVRWWEPRRAILMRPVLARLFRATAWPRNSAADTSLLEASPQAAGCYRARPPSSRDARAEAQRRHNHESGDTALGGGVKSPPAIQPRGGLFVCQPDSSACRSMLLVGRLHTWVNRRSSCSVRPPQLTDRWGGVDHPAGSGGHDEWSSRLALGAPRQAYGEMDVDSRARHQAIGGNRACHDSFIVAVMCDPFGSGSSQPYWSRAEGP